MTLKATADPNSTFTGWIGGPCDGTATSPCAVTLSVDESMTANFAPKHVLTVNVAGGTAGTVTSDTGGIGCPGVCSASYQAGTVVTLTAHPGSDATFAGWSGGGCSGTGGCQVTMSADTAVTAAFAPIPDPVAVTISGTGSGTVVSTPGGISCPSVCSANFNQGSQVTLTATPNTGSSLSWAGACSGSATTCQITVGPTNSVTLTFTMGNVTKVDDNDPAVAYAGWSDVADAAANGGYYRASNVKNDKATWTSPVTTSLTWLTHAGPNMGKASVTIDGVSKGTIDLYAPTPGAVSEPPYTGLPDQVHSVVIKVLGTKNKASSGASVAVDAFVSGSTTAQESDPSIQYDTWKDAGSTSAYGGSYRATSTASTSATVRFNGTGIDWVTGTAKSFGQASISIDGGTPVIVDLYTAKAGWQKKVFSSGALAAGPHTMVIQVLGMKNASSTGTKVMIDRFDLYS